MVDSPSRMTALPRRILQKTLVIGGKMGIMLSLDKKWF